MTPTDTRMIESLRFQNDRSTGFKQVRRTNAQIKALLVQRAEAWRAEALADGDLSARDEQVIAADLALASAVVEEG